MKEQTKEDKKHIEEKLKYIKLDIDKIPNIFEINQKIKYKPLKEYDNTTYKAYHFVDIKDTEIYITKTTRLEETEKKYKLAEPLIVIDLLPVYATQTLLESNVTEPPYDPDKAAPEPLFEVPLIVRLYPP